MLSATLEITACIIAAIFGMIGVFYGLTLSNYYLSSTYLVSISGLLVVIVVIYLSQLAEVMQNKGGRLTLNTCKVLNKLMYVTIIAQVVTTALMVN